MKRVIVYPDAATVAKAAASRLLTVLADTLAVQERADIVLTGGTVGIQTLREVAASPLVSAVDWSAVHLWWGDERFVPTGDPDRNEGQAQEALIAHLPVPAENVHRMPSTDITDSPETAAALYFDELNQHGDPEFDVLMLGVGPDGHVASLFPGHSVYEKSAATVVAVLDSPKPPPVRITLGITALNRAKRVWLVAAGEEKAESIAEALHGNTTYPAAAVHGELETVWLLDVAAASKA